MSDEPKEQPEENPDDEAILANKPALRDMLDFDNQTSTGRRRNVNLIKKALKNHYKISPEVKELLIRRLSKEIRRPNSKLREFLKVADCIALFEKVNTSKARNELAAIRLAYDVNKEGEEQPSQHVHFHAHAVVALATIDERRQRLIDLAGLGNLVATGGGGNGVPVARAAEGAGPSQPRTIPPPAQD